MHATLHINEFIKVPRGIPEFSEFGSLEFACVFYAVCNVGMTRYLKYPSATSSTNDFLQGCTWRRNIATTEAWRGINERRRVKHESFCFPRDLQARRADARFECLRSAREAAPEHGLRLLSERLVDLAACGVLLRCDKAGRVRTGMVHWAENKEYKITTNIIKYH